MRHPPAEYADRGAGLLDARGEAEGRGRGKCDLPRTRHLIVGHEGARALNKRHIFAEKEDNKLVLRRGSRSAGASGSSWWRTWSPAGDACRR